MKNKTMEKVKKILKDNHWDWDKIRQDHRNYNLNTGVLMLLINELNPKFDLSEYQTDGDSWTEATIYHKYPVVIDSDVNINIDTIKSFSEWVDYMNDIAEKVKKELKKGIKI